MSDRFVKCIALSYVDRWVVEQYCVLTNTAFFNLKINYCFVNNLVRLQ